MTTKVTVNSDKDFVLKMREKIKENDGYCPCKLHKTADTKCMCKEFRDMLSSGKTGKCHCGLYAITNSEL